MTLREFFEFLNANPLVIAGYFIVVPLIALLLGWIAQGEGNQSPWKYAYGAVLYAVCIPGIFSVALSVYLFLFERGGSIFNANVLTQIMPVVSMVLTLSIVRRNAVFEQIPGTGKLSGLMLSIGTVFLLMYLLNRTHIIAIAWIPVQYLLLIVVVLLLALRYGFRQLIA